MADKSSANPTPAGRAGRFGTRAAKRRNAEILDSLLASFNVQGCFRTGIDRVIAQVGIGKGTLYRHYSSREDLFKATLRTGIDTLRNRLHEVCETHGTDSDVGFKAVIAELVSLNRRREAVSPAALERLSCSCRWMAQDSPSGREVEAALVPLIRHWQTVGLVDGSANISLIASTITALVNAPAIIGHRGVAAVEKSEPNRSLRGAVPTPDPVDGLVDLLRRAFAPISSPGSSA